MPLATINILLAEDELAHVAAIERAFLASSSQAVIQVVQTLREYREVIAVRLPDIVLMDLNLPDGCAVEVLISPPEDGLFPVLVMTSHGDEQSAVMALKAGAMDYIVKSPETIASMPRNVESVLREWKAFQQRKQAEAQLRLENAALSAAANAILITDHAGYICQINPAFTALTGYTAEDAITRKPGELLKSGEHDAAFYRSLWETILAGHVWQGEIKNRRKDGSLYLDEQTITPVKDSNGKITHFISIRQDITGKRKMEEHLLRAQRLESVGHLASGLAHDLNNILAPILMAAPLIREEVRAPSALKMLDIVDANVRRGAEIIKQLLIFGRGTEVQRMPLKLHSLVKDMVNIVEQTFPKNIRCESDASSNSWPVNADMTQMHQVLMNLCVNARDAMPNGGTLSLTLENVEIDEDNVWEAPGVSLGRHVVLSISDTGTGIPAEYLDKIFDPFFTTKAVGQGTGLGLSTVVGIVKSHGGVIQVRSQPGAGTQFKVYLPAYTEQERPQVPPLSLNEVPQGIGELVLVVDDEVSIRRATQHTLERNGYNVEVAADGAEGLLRYRQLAGKVKVVVTDIAMPAMDGMTFIKELRSVNPKVLIIGVSGVQLDAGASEAIVASVDAFLPKPFGSEELLKTLELVLRAK